jgi:S-adenosylmethionine:tRNA ribosyltransferase-isomerase
MRTQDFDFYLPEALIAQTPALTRSSSRLLHAESNMQLENRLFSTLPLLLSPGDLLVFNDTKVIKARLFGNKLSGGAIECLVERVLDSSHVIAQLRASRAPKAGARLRFANAFDAEVLGRVDDFFHLRFLGDTPVLDCLERYGQLPLPPYITHTPETEDNQRYQTVYAKHAGAVAAPTAGLHFDADLLAKLAHQHVNMAYVTLHVGAGTFQPVRVENIADHKMHSERYAISVETADLIAKTKLNGKRVIAVGTTSLRALESAARFQPESLASEGETDIFITPGFKFKVVDSLITNFHLPKSTLLMLVSAFAGTELIKQAYAHAIEQQYRFFSYGDAMLIHKAISV